MVLRKLSSGGRGDHVKKTAGQRGKHIKRVGMGPGEHRREALHPPPDLGGQL